MRNQQILEKAIQKAIDGGWRKLEAKPELTIDSYAKWLEHGHNYLLVIFNHDFAKALWGDKWPKQQSVALIGKPWEYHLQNMVIAPDPIRYLGDNI